MEFYVHIAKPIKHAPHCRQPQTWAELRGTYKGCRHIGLKPCRGLTGLLNEESALLPPVVNLNIPLSGSGREIQGMPGEISGETTGHFPLRYERPSSLERADLTSPNAKTAREVSDGWLNSSYPLDMAKG